MSDSVTPWTVTYPASPSMGFSRQEDKNVLSFPAPVYLPNTGIKPRSPTLQAYTLPADPPEKHNTKPTQSTGPRLGGHRSKGGKNSTLKAGIRRPQTQ